MARKHTGNRSDEREEIAAEVEEALNSPTEESVGTAAEQALSGEAPHASVYEEPGAAAAGPSELLGENEPAETAGAELYAEQAAEAGAEGRAEDPYAAGAEPRPQGFGAFVGGLIHQGVYSGFYGLSYGVTFGSLLVGHLIPSNSAVAEGVRDGAEAARHALEGGLRSEHSADDAMAGTA